MAEGRLAENILYFARALRAAGLPVGPGAVLDALEAVDVARIGDREDFYWTLHAVFVKRHEHTILFDQAFKLFFRKRGYLDKLIAAMLPETLPGAPKPPPPGAQRVQEALYAGMNAREEEKQEIEVDASLTVSDREVLQKKDFAQMTGGRDRRRQGGDRAAGAAARHDQDASAGGCAPRPHDRRAPHLARQHEGGRGGDRSQIFRTAREGAADRGAPGHLRLHEPVHAAVPAFPAFDHRRAQARHHLPVRHAADQCQPRHPPARSGRGAGLVLGACGGLVGRHAHCVVPARFQQALVAPGVEPGRGGAVDHRRAGARRRRYAWISRWTGCTAPAGG